VDDRFCSRCGSRTAVGQVTEIQRPLLLDKRNKKVAGVCAGFARYLGVDVVLVRVLWLGIALCTGVGFLVYLAACIVIPSDYGLETGYAAGTNVAQTS
jgi:phage shock protein PspC (stress-responsive transcriptional regulator)